MPKTLKEALLELLYSQGWKRILNALGEVAEDCARVERENGNDGDAIDWGAIGIALRYVGDEAGAREMRPQDQ